VDPEKIKQINLLHRPRIYWLGGTVSRGCTCGAWMYPCPVVLDMHTQIDMQLAARGRPR
jgi:hypothetical protein